MAHVQLGALRGVRRAILRAAGGRAGIPLCSNTSTEAKVMAKTKNSKKQSKKAPQKSAKAKRQAKRAKKSGGRR